MQLAASGASVTAVDNAPKRLDLLRDNLQRTGLTASVVEADARTYRPDTPFDAILLDAPCSGTGIFRRHPDVLHLRAGADLEAPAALQAALLDHALTLLKPGGRLVYCTCSLEPEEGEAQIEALLGTRPEMRLDPVRADELPEGMSPAPEGWVRTLPGQLEPQGGLDGFFMARLSHA